MKLLPQNLTTNDYRILEFISNFSYVSETDIQNHFHDVPVSFHLQNLSEISFHSVAGVHIPLDNASYIHKFTKQSGNDATSKIACYSITTMGKSILAEYHNKAEIDKRDRKVLYATLIFTIISAIVGSLAFIVSLFK